MMTPHYQFEADLKDFIDRTPVETLAARLAEFIDVAPVDTVLLLGMALGFKRAKSPTP